MEASNLPEFKIVIIKMLNELKSRLDQLSENIHENRNLKKVSNNNTISEMKSSLGRIISRLVETKN